MTMKPVKIVHLDDVKPITDVRGSENYRRALAGNVLLRFWHETFSDGGNNHNGNGNGVGD